MPPSGTRRAAAWCAARQARPGIAGNALILVYQMLMLSTTALDREPQAINDDDAFRANMHGISNQIANRCKINAMLNG